MVMVWNLEPAATRTGWLVRPYRAYAADLPRMHGATGRWTSCAAARHEWRALLDRASPLRIPDAGVVDALGMPRRPVHHA